MKFHGANAGKTLKKDSEICDDVLALACRGSGAKFINEILTIFFYNTEPTMVKSMGSVLRKVYQCKEKKTV